MVQTYQSPVRIYKYPFELVMTAYEKRFPTCPQIPIFIASEIVFEYHSPDGAEEVIERKCTLNVEAPYLVKKIAGVDYVYFLQKNSLDRRKRTLLIEATNVSFSSRIVVKENCTYYVHSENPEWTCFEQNASLDVKSFFGFEAAVEKLAVKQYAANLAKGKEILEFFIDDLIKSGVTYVPPFSETHPDSNSGEATKSLTDSAIDVKENTEETEEANGDVKRKESSVETRRMSHSQTPVAGDKTARRESSGSAVHRPSTSGAIANGVNLRSPSFDDSDSKLESEYIRRFLGQLTPLEESRLCELKYGLQAAHKGKLPNDAHLLRFLRARDFDVHKARDMVIASLLWRKQHNVDKILQEFKPPSVLLQFFPGCWHHHDKQGRPVFVLRLGQMDVKGLLRSVGLEDLVKFTLLICEQGLLKAAEATKTLGQPISTWTMLVDLDGLSMRHLWRPGVQALLRIIEIVEAHYPETMGLVLILRAPRVFPVLWTLISPFIDENTRKKFMIHSSESVLAELGKYIDDEYLPDFLGGTCLCNAPTGGHVPKSAYRPVLDEVSNEDNVLTSIYSTAHVYRGAPHEICVQVSQHGCVLTWDFDIIKGECEFILYHTNKVITQPAHPHSPTSIERMTSAIASTSISPPAFGVFCDPDLKLGMGLAVQERPVTFSEGDSMQGSHYCTMTGTYILQWRSPTETQHKDTFDFSLSGHKCKLMVYHELLPAAEFHGSVASLESCRSSFSSLAAAVNPQGDNTPTPSKKGLNANHVNEN